MSFFVRVCSHVSGEQREKMQPLEKIFGCKKQKHNAAINIPSREDEQIFFSFNQEMTLLPEMKRLAHIHSREKEDALGKQSNSVCDHFLLYILFNTHLIHLLKEESAMSLHGQP